MQQAYKAAPDVKQNAISAFPCHSHSNLRVLQEADATKHHFLVFWIRRKAPDAGERHQSSKEALALWDKQWDRIVQQDGVLHRKVFSPDGEEIRQLVLLSSMVNQALYQLHHEHGHQGVERTVSLVWQRCYWPGMHQDVKCWCQQCERCQAAENTQPPVLIWAASLLHDQTKFWRGTWIGAIQEWEGECACDD